MHQHFESFPPIDCQHASSHEPAVDQVLSIFHSEK